MTQAAIILVKQIRQQFPNIVIMLNRCFELISSLETDIDMLLAESIYTTYDFYHERYSHQPVNVYEEISEQLKQFKKNNKQVDIFTLDYWDQTDHQSINDIYTTQRNMGFIPYVSTVLLDQLYVQPKIIS
jgi:endo-alpha-1,4-polygalactosaminidase (GH114 family)